ncbi:cytochrome P450 3A31-like protein, partial [Leptotrombidium deliense]
FGIRELRREDEYIVCGVGEITIGNPEKVPIKSQVSQHVNSAVHKSNLKKPVQSRLDWNQQNHDTNKQREFNEKLLKWMIQCDFPLAKVQTEVFKVFIEDISVFKCPSESNLRKNYIPKLYNQKVEEILGEIGEEYLWVSVDETTDSRNHIVAAFIRMQNLIS